MKDKSSHKAAFTLVEIMTVVAIIGLLAAIAIPNFVKARTTSQANACINNLRQIDSAVQQWALEFKKPASASVALSDVTPFLKDAVICPAAGPGATISTSYATTTVQSNVTCLINPTTHVLPP